MTGQKISSGRKRIIISAMLAAVVLTGCDETRSFALPASTGANTAASAAPSRSETVEQDVERPDIFEVTDRGLWDGRPSLGGIWVAHPDVADPERVIIRNPANGKSVVGALFRRERENPGPLLQVSSDAAEALDILAGAPTQISVVVLRREEITVEAPPEENPVIADLDAPVTVQETPLDPVDPLVGAAAAIAAAEAVTPDIDVDLPPVASVAAPAETGEVEIPQATAEDAMTEIQEAATELAPAPALSGPLIQIGVFSVQQNADGAATKLNNAGIRATVLPQQAGGRTVWRVVAGPAADADAQAAMLAQIKELGFADAFGFDG